MPRSTVMTVLLVCSGNKEKLHFIEVKCSVTKNKPYRNNELTFKAHRHDLEDALKGVKAKLLVPQDIKFVEALVADKDQHFHKVKFHKETFKEVA